MYSFIFKSQVELGFDIKRIHWTIIHSQPKRCWKFDILGKLQLYQYESTVFTLGSIYREGG